MFKNFHIPIIIFAVLFALISNFGSVIAAIEFLTFTNINITNQGYISIFDFNQTYWIGNQWWRLITPIFIHFSFAHLAFNCLWIFILGEKIENTDGSLIFILLVIFSAILSNCLQYFWTETSLFGGLSGVIYGLIGFCMIIEFDTQYERYKLPPALYLFMIVWLLLGFAGILDLFGFGSVANFAHLGGLISGILFAMIYKNIYVRL
ncbi:MAG: peptidase, S54 family protein [Gammaproteobacteria bacterium]|jgi:GlpG protein|nr:peptidase, S54 family protein [Gammaproteobacteria bacterium]|tara:strand:+ start:37985 stop:38602 length:618 start_codon:yes stop_codon:yes gene_type:complete